MTESASATLFVGRLSSDANQRDIEELFGKYGKLSRCFLKDKGAQSYAFVTFEDSASATKAFEELQGVELNGNKINIEKAKSSDRPRGPRTGGSHHAYPPAHTPYGYPPAAYPDARGAPYYAAPPPRGSSRRSRSRSPPRGYPSSYDYGRPPYEQPYGYAPVAHDPAAYPTPYAYPPHYDPYAYQPYGQPAYGYAGAAYPGAYMPPGSSSNRSRSPYRGGRGSSPQRSERSSYSGRNARPRATEDVSSSVTAPAATASAPPAPAAYSDAYPSAAQ